MFSVLLIFSVYISFVDIKGHLITNKSLKYLFLLLMPFSALTGSDLHPVAAMVTLVVGVVTYRFGLGAGDVKLTVLLSLFFAPTTYEKYLDALIAFSIISIGLAAVNFCRTRLTTGSIALGPAICVAFIWCAR